MNRKWLIISVSFGLFLGILVGIFIFFQSRYRQIVVSPNIPKNISPTVTPTPDPDRPFSILLLGYGGPGHEGPYLTDSIMLARISPKLRQIDLISLPRDVWVSLPLSSESTQSSKINLAYSIGLDDKKYPHKAVEFTGSAGGGQLSKYAVSQVTGINPDYFFGVDFAAFTQAIDKLGGIDVRVQNTFDDPFYPLGTGTTDTCGKSEEDIKALTATLSGEKLEHEFSCRYETLHFDRGLTHMDGATALKYARSRHSPTDGGDFNRASRQRQVVDALKNRVLSLNFFGKIIPLVNTLSRHLITDMDLPTMETYLLRAPEFSGYKINSLPITDKNF